MSRISRTLFAGLLAAAALVSSASAGQSVAIVEPCGSARHAWACYYTVVLEATFIRPGQPERIVIRRSSGVYNVDQEALTRAFCGWRLAGSSNGEIVLPSGFSAH